MLSATYFSIAVISALVPWVNAEVLMLSAVPLAQSPVHLAWLVGMVTIGQMAGKSVMYWISRRATGARSPAVERAIDRWRRRISQRPFSAIGLTLVSSIAGVPPFYLVSIAAGAARLAFGRFLAVGLAGRLIHFGLIAFAPELIRRVLP